VYSKKAHEIIRHRYANPQTNNDVWLYEVVNAGHNWFTDDMDTGEEVWNFFKRYLE
jgi:poly(3-hydroxybutyrate) depolymerase